MGSFDSLFAHVNQQRIHTKLTESFKHEPNETIENSVQRIEKTDMASKEKQTCVTGKEKLRQPTAGFKKHETKRAIE